MTAFSPGQSPPPVSTPIRTKRKIQREVFSALSRQSPCANSPHRG
jgi:hypothetical protein